MTIEQLKKIKEKNHDVVTVRRLIAEEGAKLSENTDYRKQVLVCGGTGCTSSSSMLVIEALEKELKEKGQFMKMAQPFRFPKRHFIKNR